MNFDIAHMYLCVNCMYVFELSFQSFYSDGMIVEKNQHTLGKYYSYYIHSTYNYIYTLLWNFIVNTFYSKIKSKYRYIFTSYIESK